MPGEHNTVSKFAVVASDGRRSSEWRVWTGRENGSPKDDAYLAPAKSVKEFKISLHPDNMAQYGLSDSMRARIRTGDRHAPLRWEMDQTEITAGWTPGYVLRFPEQELESVGPCTSETIQIPSAPAGGQISVLVAIGKPDAAPLESSSAGEVIALLDRQNGGKVALVVVQGPFDASTFAELDIAGRQFGWALPTLVTNNDPFGWIVHRFGDTQSSTEFSSIRHKAERSVVSLQGFVGEVYTIHECPPEILHQDAACAVLICGPKGNELFVDERARCSHHHLAADAADLVDTYERSDTDHCWGPMTDGRLHTMISTKRVVEERGIGPWAYGPTKKSASGENEG